MKRTIMIAAAVWLGACVTAPDPSSEAPAGLCGHRPHSAVKSATPPSQVVYRHCLHEPDGPDAEAE